MTVKIYGSDRSTCTRLVLSVAHGLGIPFELVNVDMAKGEHKEADFLKNQPFGKVPYLIDGSFHLYESRAMARYLCNKNESANAAVQLYPTDLKQRALVDQYMSVEQSNYYGPVTDLVREVLFKKFRGQETDPVAAEKAKTSLEAILDIYDKILEGKTYLVDNHLTLADLSHIPMGFYACQAGYNDLFDSRPNVKRWWDKITSSEAWQKTVAQ